MKLFKNLTPSKKTLTYLFAISFGIVLIGMGSELHPEHEYDLEMILHHSLIHIGVAFVVACAIAVTFELAHQKEIVLKFLHVLTRQTNHLATTVTRLNNTMDFALKEGIVAFHRHHDQTLENAVLQAISEAKEFVFVQARTLSLLPNESIVKQPEVLYNTLNKTLDASPDIHLTFLLANVFDDKSDFMDEVKLITSDPSTTYQAERTVARGILDLAAELKRKNPVTEIALRFYNETVPFFMVMTEKVGIIGHYLPFSKLDRAIFMRLTPPSLSNGECLYDSYRQEFFILFAMAKLPERVIEQYIERHRQDRSFSDRDRQTWERLQDVATRLKTAKICALIKPAEIRIHQQKIDHNRFDLPRVDGATTIQATYLPMESDHDSKKIFEECTKVIKSAKWEIHILNSYSEERPYGEKDAEQRRIYFQTLEEMSRKVEYIRILQVDKTQTIRDIFDQSYLDHFRAIIDQKQKDRNNQQLSKALELEIVEPVFPSTFLIIDNEYLIWQLNEVAPTSNEKTKESSASSKKEHLRMRAVVIVHDPERQFLRHFTATFIRASRLSSRDVLLEDLKKSESENIEREYLSRANALKVQAR
ncbi:MAG: hypothetical protein HY268_03215 [Deltaproteobacteria bacterium]|nr:hypothetical protein [Deltaproteobacteria bacterium]